jgi:hypothetical protein
MLWGNRNIQTKSINGIGEKSRGSSNSIGVVVVAKVIVVLVVKYENKRNKNVHIRIAYIYHNNYVLCGHRCM